MRTIAALVAVLATFGASGNVFAGFYHPPAEALPGPPGSLLRSQPIEGAPAGAQAFRVLYRSRGLDDEPIAVSGLVIVPAGPAPAGGRGVIAWAHPTTGIATRCAPSWRSKPFASIPGLEDMLAQGFVVTATDYPGLGTQGPHPYLVGISAGRAVLDSVRAARALPEANASARFAAFGHSQGGHAVLFAGELAAAYAPELQPVGIAAAAPATSLVDLFEADYGTFGGRVITALLLWSWSRIYDVSTENVINPREQQGYERIANSCVETLLKLAVLRAADLFQGSFLKADPAKTSPWRELMQKNSAGRAPPGAPLLLLQGTADDIVPAELTARFVETRCGEGHAAQYRSFPDIGHLTIANEAASASVKWIAERFAAADAPKLCARR